MCDSCGFLGLVLHVVNRMHKLNTLIKCLPDSRFTQQLIVEINQVILERDRYKAAAKKFEWLIVNSGKWSWNPAQYNKNIISGFAANSSGYLGYSFHDALKLAMRNS